MRDTFIGHDLKGKHRDYLDNLLQGKVEDEPYKLISNIYNGRVNWSNRYRNKTAL